MKGMNVKLKKLLAVTVCLSLICTILGVQGFGIQTVYAATDSKITGVTATASSESTNPAAYAIDTSTEETWWSAYNPGPCWLQLTLDHTYYIDRWYVINVGIYSQYDPIYDTANTRDYKLQASLDGTNWTDIDSVAGNTADITNRTVTPFSAKYVRINITDPDQNASMDQAFGNIVDFEVFATAPTVTSVELPSNKNYSAGDALTFKVKYPTEVTVNTTGGTPYIPVTIGTKTAHAVYKSGSGTQALTFEYIVQSGDYDDNGIALGTNINGNGGTIKDAVSNNANLTLNGVGGTSGIVVDARSRYNISIGTLVGGSITASVPSPYSTSAVVAGETVNLNITPASGKQMKAGSLKYNDGTLDHTITGTSFIMPGANVTVSAEFENIPHIVAIGSLTGGTITADKGNAAKNETVNLTITPNTGKQLKSGSLKYNDGTQDTAITGTSFTMPDSNVTVSAEFETKSCTVQFNPNWTTIVPAAEVSYGEKITPPNVDTPGVRQDGWYTDSNFTTRWNFDTDTVRQDITLYLKFTTIGNITFQSNGGGTVPSQTIGIGEKVQEPIGVEKGGYILDGWYLSSDFSGTRYDFNTTVTTTETNQMRTLYAKWIPVPVYNIAVDVLNGGSITVNPSAAKAGDTVTLTITPNAGKWLKSGSLKYNDGSANHVITGTSFTMPAANITISAVFEDAPPIAYPIMVGPMNGGMILANMPMASPGSNVSLSIIPAPGKQLKAGSLKYNNGMQDVMITGTSFVMPSAPIMVMAEFEDISAGAYTVAVGTITGGNITANPVSAVSGSSISLTIVPNSGKQLKAGSLKYNDGTQEVAITGTSFTMPAANVMVTAEFEDISGIPVQPANASLIGIVNPPAINGLMNGTAKSSAALGLPATVNIITSEGNKSAAVVWDVATCTYNPYSINTQSFIVAGILTLPSGVVNINNINLSITTSVTVNQIANPGSSTGGSSNNGGGTGESNPITNTESKLPSVEGSEAKGWDSITQYIAEKNTGSITVNMSGDTTVKQDVFEAVKGKDIDLTFDLGNGIQWDIQGKDIPASMDDSQLHGIDLSLSMNSDSIPAELLNTLPDTEKVQLSLAYDGSFGFTATLRLPLGEKNSGKFANLFYHNPVTNQLELQAVGVVDKSGTVGFPFTHASDYVVVMSDTAMLGDAINMITVTPVKKTLYIGGTKGKNTTIKTSIPEVVQKAVSDGLCNMKVTYKSSNPKVAAISNSGKIIAKKTGTITITTTITINGVKKSYQNRIKVKKA